MPLTAFFQKFPSLITTLLISAASVAQSQVTVSWSGNPEPDIAGYVFYLGTASGVYTTIQDVGNSTSRLLTGLSTTVVYHCAIQAYNTTGQTSALSAEISFSLDGVSPSFGTWATNGGLSGNTALPSAVPFPDGVSNLLKYAFNMNPAGADLRVLAKGAGAAGLPLVHLDTSGAQPMFTIEYLRRKGGGLVYTPKSSTNLLDYEPVTGTTTVTSIDSLWERVVVQKTVSTATTPRIFGRVEVTMP